MWFLHSFFKGLIDPKMKILSLITLMLFQTGKTFVHMQSFVTLHRQQHRYHVQGPER